MVYGTFAGLDGFVSDNRDVDENDFSQRKMRIYFQQMTTFFGRVFTSSVFHSSSVFAGMTEQRTTMRDTQQQSIAALLSTTDTRNSAQPFLCCFGPILHSVEFIYHLFCSC